MRIQTNVMSNVEFNTIAWGETLFKNTFETVWQIVQTVVSHQKPCSKTRSKQTLFKNTFETDWQIVQSVVSHLSFAKLPSYRSSQKSVAPSR